MAYDFSNLKKEREQIKEWLAKEFSGIRTGRATPALLDNITIDLYGSKSQISHVAGITTEDARTLRVSPWDKGQVKAIEKAITSANLGVSVATDDSGLRVIFPELTRERRTLLMKIVGEKIEKAKISMRGERENVLNDIQNKCKDGEISEDDKFKYKEELQGMVDAFKEELEGMGGKKEKEIME